MKNSLVICAVLLLFAFCMAAHGAAEAPKPPTFVQAVITKAISLMPEDLKTKLKPVEKEIATAATPPASSTQSTKTVRYYVEAETGSGPATFSDQFRAVRKKIGESATYPVLAPYLGKLAGTLIELSQPYHTEDKAFKSTGHPTFDKALDASTAVLKAEADGNQKVTNPSEFAVQSAKSASDLLTKATSTDAAVLKEAQSAVFSLAVNSITDTWWTLLSAEKAKPAAEGETATAPTDGNFIGNTRSLKFHLPTCRYLPAEKNRVYFKTKDEAVSQGYIACKVCKP